MTTLTALSAKAAHRLGAHRLGHRPARSPDAKRVRSERAGRMAEWLAAALLWLRGYRILARRHRTASGEIDLIAVRGQRLAFIEVKQRALLADAEHCIADRQIGRLHRAAEAWIARHPRFSDYERGFDLALVAPGQWPRYLADHLQPLVGQRF